MTDEAAATKSASTQTRSAIDDAMRAAAARIRRAAGGWDAERQAARSEWSTRQVLAHLIAVTEIYRRYAEGETRSLIDVEHLAAENLRLISEVDERDPAALADGIIAGVDAYLASTAALPLDAPHFWHGREVTVGAVKGLIVGELTFHGLDIARAHKEKWPISQPAARAVIDGAVAILPMFIAPAADGVTATYGVSLRGGGSYTLEFDDGRVSVSVGLANRVDCRISADPVAFALVAYGRESQWRHIATGHMLAWGRKPWLGFRLTKLLLKP